VAATRLKREFTVSKVYRDINGDEIPEPVDEGDFKSKPEIRGGNRPIDFIPEHGDADIVVEDSDPESEDE
jgi:hypothetical protein